MVIVLIRIRHLWVAGDAMQVLPTRHGLPGRHIVGQHRTQAAHPRIDPGMQIVVIRNNSGQGCQANQRHIRPRRGQDGILQRQSHCAYGLNGKSAVFPKERIANRNISDGQPVQVCPTRPLVSHAMCQFNPPCSRSQFKGPTGRATHFHPVQPQAGRVRNPHPPHHVGQDDVAQNNVGSALPEIKPQAGWLTGALTKYRTAGLPIGTTHNFDPIRRTARIQAGQRHRIGDQI